MTYIAPPLLVASHESKVVSLTTTLLPVINNAPPSTLE